jgi:hypothetical protein
VKINDIRDNAIDMYPNPAKSETNIEVVLSNDSDVKIELLDASSKLVKVIKTSDVQVAGNSIYNVNLETIPAGVYNVLITIDGVTTQKKLIRIE